MTSARSYCLDTSALIHAAVRAYPMDVFGSFWTRLECLIDEGRAIARKEVEKEIKKQDDELRDRCKGRSSLFVAPEVEIQQTMSAVAQQFPSLVNQTKLRGLADPWVVATAQTMEATVVTQEGSKPTKPKIPDACRALGIPCLNLLDFIRAEGWTWNDT